MTKGSLLDTDPVPRDDKRLRKERGKEAATIFTVLSVLHVSRDSDSSPPTATSTDNFYYNVFIINFRSLAMSAIDACTSDITTNENHNCM